MVQAAAPIAEAVTIAAVSGPEGLSAAVNIATAAPKVLEIGKVAATATGSSTWST